MISIIIPVYNTESYLENCLTSVVNQTDKNYEVILVDDGSIDNSWSICKQYAAKYDFITCLHQSNQGPGAARNLGIKYAKGEYISFVDSDDTVTNDYVQTILENMRSDLLFFNIKVVNSDGEETGDVVLPEVFTLSNINDTIYSFITRQRDAFSFILTVNKCYCTEIIKLNNLTYPTGIIHSEDEIFTLKYLQCIKTMQSVKNYIYIHYAWGSSASKPIYKEEFSQIVTHIYELSNSYNSESLQEFLKTRWAFFYFIHYRNYRHDLQYVWERLINELTPTDFMTLRNAFVEYKKSSIYYPERRFVLFLSCIFQAYKVKSMSRVLMYSFYIVDSFWLIIRTLKSKL